MIRAPLINASLGRESQRAATVKVDGWNVYMATILQQNDKPYGLHPTTFHWVYHVICLGRVVHLRFYGLLIGAVGKSPPIARDFEAPCALRSKSFLVAMPFRRKHCNSILFVNSSFAHVRTKLSL